MTGQMRKRQVVRLAMAAVIAEAGFLAVAQCQTLQYSPGIIALDCAGSSLGFQLNDTYWIDTKQSTVTAAVSGTNHAGQPLGSDESVNTYPARITSTFFTWNTGNGPGQGVHTINRLTGIDHFESTAPNTPPFDSSCATSSRPMPTAKF